MSPRNHYCLSAFLLLLLLAFLPSRLLAQEHVFTVEEGASPWFDRVGQWSLADIPDSVKGSGPLPQGDCNSRSLVVPEKSKAITIGVQKNDVEKFSEKYPDAKETGDQISVKNPEGVTLPYTIFTLENPPETIDGKGVFGAGLLLLKIENGGSASAAPTASPVAAVVQQPLQPFEPCEKSKLHLYLLIGQSNMVGRDTADLDQQTDDPRVGYLGGDGSHWLVAREPMHSGGSGVGPGISFAEEMLKAGTAEKIGLIPCAVGGTPLSRWVKGGDLYANALKRAHEAMEVGELKGVLWHQGESDSDVPELAESYESRLTQMIADLRQDLGMPDLPVVVGQLGEFVKSRYVGKVRTAIQHLSSSLPDLGFADANGLKDKGDSLHFSAEAEREFGKRYATAMLELERPKASS